MTDPNARFQAGAGRFVLITGASAGIGAAFAEVFAAEGFDLVLTARRGDRLEALAADLSARHRVRVLTLVEDLADPDAPARLMARLAEQGVTLSGLVNNAGFGVPGDYGATPWKAQADLIQVLVTACCHLAHLALPQMIERRYGRLINVASVAGLLPGTPGATLYGPAKAFLIAFTKGLSVELAGTGVHATAVCPGYTWSEFHDVTGTRETMNKLPRWLWLTAESVAREGFEAVTRGDPVVVNGRQYRALTGISKHLPDGLTRALMRRGR